MKDIFFHVGISKTGSTFLQHRVFPQLHDITYIPTNRFKQYKTLTKQSNSPKILLSREFDRQMEREVKAWSADFPQTKSILVLRRQDGWIASQYRRFVKNGYGLDFREFIDIENDKGFWQRDNLFFYNYIEILEHYFDHPPLVLLYDDLRTAPLQFIQRIANYTQSSFRAEDLDFTKVHASYNEKQLKVMLQAGKYLNINNLKPFKASLLNAIYKYAYVYPLRYGTLYGALWYPKAWLSDAPLIPEENVAAIRDYYAADWQRCLDYAGRQLSTY